MTRCKSMPPMPRRVPPRPPPPEQNGDSLILDLTPVILDSRMCHLARSRTLIADDNAFHEVRKDYDCG
eukprot:685466-Lingulodinium_polyedra.AAC.1